MLAVNVCKGIPESLEGCLEDFGYQQFVEQIRHEQVHPHSERKILLYHRLIVVARPEVTCDLVLHIVTAIVTAPT